MNVNTNVIEKLVKQFWDEHYTRKVDGVKIGQEERIKLVNEFLRDHLGVDEYSALATNYNDYSAVKIKHPALRKKNYYRSYLVFDVLTDFILAADQVAERFNQYPIDNADKQWRDEQEREETQRSIVFDEDIVEDEYKLPSYSVFEHDFNEYNSVETILFGDGTASKIEELTALILEVKSDVEHYVKKYANSEKNWNDKEIDKKRTPDNVRKAIINLDITRIISCEECSGAFYAHDRRQKICNIQPYKNNKSNCQNKQKRKRENNKYKERKIKEIQDLEQKKHHILIDGR
ncbi:hypothetical protein [Bacillus sp. Marseille-P3661]|uniref:hypothetical protein n=1 Tax=Bacillus sp. Marseille-P3661 TaxID=1936234 RepID=UPI000C863828|nr:hypothetical protein [Bacillus sp. Marseille-P3661]